MDQVEYMREAGRSAHSAFHQYILRFSNASEGTWFFFLEGNDDWAFYGQFSTPRIATDYHLLICKGRDKVLRAQELCLADGRGIDHCLFFIDKDHHDIMVGSEALPSEVFQTEFYSFENYVVSESVFRRFWSERLQLDIADPRYGHWRDCFLTMYDSFIDRAKVLMAGVLVCRGLKGGGTIPMNLNEVNIGDVFSLDFSNKRVRWKKGALRRFFGNLGDGGAKRIALSDVKIVIREQLSEMNPKVYLRGKYELWFFVSFLEYMSRSLSNREESRRTGSARATPRNIITHGTAIDSLCGLVSCPVSLRNFLNLKLGLEL